MFPRMPTEYLFNNSEHIPPYEKDKENVAKAFKITLYLQQLRDDRSYKLRLDST